MLQFVGQQDNGEDEDMGDVADDLMAALMDSIMYARKAPGGASHWLTRYDEDGDPYGELCWCTDSDGEDHE